MTFSYIFQLFRETDSKPVSYTHLESLKKESRESEELFKDAEEELLKLKEELKVQKIISGYYDVKGPGTIITIDAEPDKYLSLASSHQYILALISYLNNAGVEAISINGQRYINYTEIVPVLDHINLSLIHIFKKAWS